MRNRVSTLFFILAAGLVSAHIFTTAQMLNHQQNRQSAVYRVLRAEVPKPENKTEAVDYKNWLK